MKQRPPCRCTSRKCPISSFPRKNVTPADTKPGRESRISRTMATTDWMPAPRFRGGRLWVGMTSENAYATTSRIRHPDRCDSPRRSRPAVARESCPSAPCTASGSQRSRHGRYLAGQPLTFPTTFRMRPKRTSSTAVRCPKGRGSLQLEERK